MPLSPSEQYWEMVDRLKLTHLYTVPTVIKFLMKAGDDHVDKYNLSSLKVLALGKTGVCYNSHFALSDRFF